MVQVVPVAADHENAVANQKKNYNTSSAGNKLKEKYRCIPNIDDNRLIFRANDFPYTMESGIEHYVVWTMRKEDVTQKEIVSILEENLGELRKYEFVTMTNSLSLKSIKSINHTHIFVRLKEVPR